METHCSRPRVVKDCELSAEDCIEVVCNSRSSVLVVSTMLEPFYTEEMIKYKLQPTRQPKETTSVSVLCKLAELALSCWSPPLPEALEQKHKKDDDNANVLAAKYDDMKEALVEYILAELPKYARGSHPPLPSADVMRAP
jgi:hypothetical protein